MTSSTTLQSILIIEADSWTRDLLKAMVPQDSTDVLECSDASEAVNFYSEFGFDWVILDLKADAAETVDTARRIRMAFPSAKIVMVSAYHDSQHQAAARCAGASAYLFRENMHRAGEMRLFGARLAS